MRPSQQLKAVLSGKITPDKCDNAVRSWLRLTVYRIAEKVIDLPFDRRIIEINKQPEGLRELVKQEVIRLNKIGV